MSDLFQGMLYPTLNAILKALAFPFIEKKFSPSLVQTSTEFEGAYEGGERKGDELTIEFMAV